MQILLIEDERKIAAFLKQGLKGEGYVVVHACTGQEGLLKAAAGSWDVLILDVKLPDMEGIEICATLRKEGFRSPIIMLTAKDGVEDKIRGLDAGADDYLTKPFSFSELLARIRAVTRRLHPLVSEDELVVGPLCVNVVAADVRREGKVLMLSGTELRLLKCLMDHAPRVVSKAVLLEKVWGFDFSPESNIVEVYINYLREKVDKKFAYPLIHTVHGIGYKLCDLS